MTCWRVFTKCKPVYDLHLQGILLATFHSWNRQHRPRIFVNYSRSSKERNMMKKQGILFRDFSKMKVINISVHTNVKVPFQWLWLTLNVTFPLFLILQKYLQTFFLGEELERKDQKKRNLSRRQPGR